MGPKKCKNDQNDAMKYFFSALVILVTGTVILWAVHT